MPQLFDHDHAYIFQNPDRRIIFAIPYEGDFTLIGTTDVEHHGADRRRRASTPPRSPTCASRPAAISRSRSTPADVVWSYSGVRPLLDDEAGDPSAVTRDYLLELDADAGAAADGVGRQDHHLPQAGRGGRRPARAALLADDARRLDRERLPARRRPERPGSARRGGPTPTSCASCRRSRCATRRCRRRCCTAWRAPTARASRLLLGTATALGAEVAPGLHEAELRYLHDHEWARSADDVLWRRSKLGLHLSAGRARRRRALVRRALADATAHAGAGDGARMELTLERIEQRVGAAT